MSAWCSLSAKGMENTPHVMLAGEGAQANCYCRQDFRLRKKAGTLTGCHWICQWKGLAWVCHDNLELGCRRIGQMQEAVPPVGLAYKNARKSRGDSPIIGAGYFVGLMKFGGSATATRIGRDYFKEVGGSFLISGMMRQGEKRKKKNPFPTRSLAKRQ